MDVYVVGGVADLISKGSLCDFKAKKEKNKSSNKKIMKIIDSKGTLVEKTEKRSTATSVTQTKQENKTLVNSVGELSVDDDFISKRNIDVMNSLNNNQLDKNKSPSLKRRKSLQKTGLNVNDSKPLPKGKKLQIDSLSLDNIPSDSEQEEKDENVRNNFIGLVKSNKTSVYTDLKENTVFIGNIPINYDKQKICRVFSKFGEIQSARIRCVPIPDINMSKRVAAIKKKFSPKRNSLVAYVKFKSKDSANAALKANGMVIDGHHLRVDFAEKNKERDNNKAVFVGGLPFDIEDDELWEFFEHCGKINSVRIVRDSQTSMGKGFGYVNFDSTASVELALRLNGQELKKRTINVKRYVKARNKNKLNSFSKSKSNEMTDQLLCKRAKKFKEKKKKEKKELSSGFQGRVASIKQKKKKKLTKAALRQRKLVKILGASYDKNYKF